MWIARVRVTPRARSLFSKARMVKTVKSARASASEKLPPSRSSATITAVSATPMRTLASSTSWVGSPSTKVTQGGRSAGEGRSAKTTTRRAASGLWSRISRRSMSVRLFQPHTTI
ncbi:hypothetical protein D3C86_1953620 [compost metagenome]